MASNRNKNREELRTRYLSGVLEHLETVGEEVLRTNSNEIAIPCLDVDGNEEWVVITFKVPTGSRDGDAYDGYSVAEEYEIKQKLKAEKAIAAAKAKEKKIAKDKAKRGCQVKTLDTRPGATRKFFSKST